jgi:hypothetical protein
MSDKPSPQDLAHRAAIYNALRQRDTAEIDVRVERYLRAEYHPIVANSWFAAASSECIGLFSDGYFYGCISQCQAVGEALIRFMCQCNKFHPKSDFEENVRLLKQRAFIDDEFENLCSCLWEYRHDYHHMNKGIETDRQRLEQIALTKIRTLAELEKWVFQYSDTHGGVTPKWPKYWQGPKDGKYQVYLRLSP